MMNHDSSTRHRWVKLRLHVYMCRSCGTAYENRHQTMGNWERVYFLPTGETRRLRQVPACEPGPRTPAALKKYADAL